MDFRKYSEHKQNFLNTLYFNNKQYCQEKQKYFTFIESEKVPKIYKVVGKTLFAAQTFLAMRDKGCDMCNVGNMIMKGDIKTM